MRLRSSLIRGNRCKASLSKKLYLWSSSRRSMKGFGTRCFFVFFRNQVVFLLFFRNQVTPGPGVRHNFFGFDSDGLSAQVPMDPTHVRSFLNTAVFGTFITKITIMHAYQTCIKRIVRFANSLQVWKRSGGTFWNSYLFHSGLC